MADNDIDLYFIVESWIKDEDLVVIGDLEDDGKYSLINSPRIGRIGGGICCLHKSNLKVTRKNTVTMRTMEYLETTVEVNTNVFSVVTIYRPGSTAKNRYSMNDFYSELTQVFGHYSTYRNEVIIIGDFNLHINKSMDVNARRFQELLQLFDLHQHVSEPTHRDGNTLDLVITRTNTKLLKCNVDDMNSDHMNVLISLDVAKPTATYKTITFRQYKNIDMNTFKNDLRSQLSYNSPLNDDTSNLSNLLDKFASASKVLDKHAPRKVATLRARKPNPWSRSDIKAEKAERRRLEKKWRRSRKRCDFEAFKCQRNKYNASLNKLRQDHLSQTISKNRQNPRDMFKALNRALHRKTDLPLPTHSDETGLANAFSDFFEEKIKNIRSKLDNNCIHPLPEVVTFSGTCLQNFRMMTRSEVKKILNNMSKSCKLDPLPLWLAKDCIDELLPIITDIINLSLSSGEMPKQLKHAIIRPLLKKAGLELTKKNYRPVSNLSYLSKAVEAAVIMQYQEHLSRNNLDDNKQSAYKKYHSTETLLLKVHNDIMTSLDKGDMVMLVMLDLSAAFDTIDHNILTERLQHKYGITGNALRWFKSYLSDRTQSVAINDIESSKKTLKYGVPQGSKLGPVLFNSYIAPLSNVAEANGIIDEKYADDEQLILSFKPSCQRSASSKMEKCIEEIRKFLYANKLCNNSDKTEFMLIGGSQQLKKVEVNTIKVDKVTIDAVDKVKNLGVLFDRTMSMEAHVNNMCKKAYFNIRNISQIRKSLSKEDTKTAVHALVTPHLDYGNALLYGTKKKTLDKTAELI